MAGGIARELHSLAAVAAVWAFGGLLSVCGALALARLGAALPAAGGLYVYLARAFGPRTGFVYGWSAVALIPPDRSPLSAAINLYRRACVPPLDRAAELLSWAASRSSSPSIRPASRVGKWCRTPSRWPRSPASS